MLLARPDPRMDMKFSSSISNKYYFYFSNKSKEACVGELVKLGNHMRHASALLDFRAVGQGEVFVPDCIWKEIEMLKEHVYPLNVEKNWCLEEI